MNRPSLSLRRSFVMRNGQGCLHSILGISMETHEQEIEALLLEVFEDIISSKLPKGLLQMKLIARAEDYTNKEYQRQVQKVLEGKMDKLAMFLSDNIFGRKEVLLQEKKVGQIKQQNEDQLDGVMAAYEQLNKEITELVLGRAQRTYLANLGKSQVSTQLSEETAQEKQRSEELAVKSSEMLFALKRINHSKQHDFNSFILEAGQGS